MIVKNFQSAICINAANKVNDSWGFGKGQKSQWVNTVLEQAVKHGWWDILPKRKNKVASDMNNTQENCHDQYDCNALHYFCQWRLITTRERMFVLNFSLIVLKFYQGRETKFSGIQNHRILTLTCSGVTGAVNAKYVIEKKMYIWIWKM